MIPREAARARGLKRGWIATQMGISPSYLSKLITGERQWTPELQSLFALAIGIAEEAIYFALEIHSTCSREPQRVQTGNTPVEPEKVG